MDRVPRGSTFTSPNEVVTCCVQNLHHKNGDKSSIVCTKIDTGAQHELPLIS
ncbi:hypothetical protein DPMN_086978 [Dreissena polymorpha]|uniref:Uncharacterized protein n=1 Tax=Dreissena polymorpha TaxID=45954 RepID=A0A9D4KRV5_DREPO|nr:hypothetical protein DPMN_086978 [Dreissena polymorpha]